MYWTSFRWGQASYIYSLLQASELHPMHIANAYPHPYHAYESQNPNPIAPTQPKPKASSTPAALTNQTAQPPQQAYLAISAD